MKSTIFLFTGILLSGLALRAQSVDHEMMAFIKSEAMHPSDYVVSVFDSNDVVLLAEQHLVRDNLYFVQQLIPALHKAGVYNLGMEFGAAEDQELLDSLLTAPAYNDDLARKIMFHYNVTWGYREYIDLYRVVWDFNHSLPKKDRKFRIINLSYVYQWKDFDGTRSVESMRKVFPKGTADKFRAEVIEKEVLSKGEKILCLVGTPHAFTKYSNAYYQYNADDFVAYDRGWLGNRLYDKHPGKVFSILLHQPFYKLSEGEYKLVSPCDGVIEQLMAQFRNAPKGFTLANSPIGRLRDNSEYSFSYADFTLEQLFDGYIFLAPFAELKGCTPLYNFVNESNIRNALEQFPDPDWHEPVTNLEEMRAFMLQQSQRIEQEYGKI